MDKKNLINAKLKKRKRLLVYSIIGLLISFIILSFVFFTFPPVYSATDNVYVSADAYTKSNSPDQNTGGNNELRCQKETGASAYERPWLKFSLNGLPSSGIDIVSANVYLYFYSNGLKTAPSTTSVRFSSNDSWTEMGITWNTEPSFGSAEDSTDIGGFGWYSWDVTSKVEQEYSGDKTITLVFVEETDNNQLIFYSRDYDSYDSYIAVTYTYYPTIGITTITSTSNYWYSQYTTYEVSVPVTDSDGYTDITEVRIRLGDSTHEYKWAGTDFTEIVDTGNFFTLQSGGTYMGSENLRTVVFKLKADWTAGDGLKTVYAYAKDSEGLEDGWDNEGDLFTVESDLTSANLVVDDYRVNPSQTLTMYGFWRYQGTSIAPPDGDYQVTVKLSGVQKGSVDTTLVSGFFNITDVTAESTVNQYMYTVEATYMSGLGTFNTVTVDRIEIYTDSLDDSRVNVNDNIEFRIQARLDFDNHALGSGDSITANFGALSWDATNSWFDGVRSQGTVGDYTFSVSSGNEATYGITTIWDNTGDTEIGVWDALNASSYSIDFTNQQLSIQLIYQYGSTAVNNGNVSYASTVATTNSTGWAVFDLSVLNDFSYNTVAYGVQDSAYGISSTIQNQTVPLAKKSLVIQSVEPATTLSSLSYESNEFKWSATGTGSNTFKIYTTQNVYYLKINGITKIEGDQWSKSGNIVTVTDTLSKHTYILGFHALESDDDNAGPGSSSSRKTVVEQAREFVENVVVPTSVAIASNWISVMLLGGLLCGTVGFYSARPEDDLWMLFLTGFVILSVNFLFAYILIPMEVFPSDLNIIRNLIWKPPTLQLATYPLGTTLLLQIIVYITVFVTVIGSVIVLVVRRD